MSDEILRILAEHHEQYIHHPGGSGSNLRLLMLCEDTIAAIQVAVGFEPEL